MSTQSSIKLLTWTRFSLWLVILFTCLATRTLFIIQTWSQILCLIFIGNILLFALNPLILTRRCDQTFSLVKYFLVITLLILTICTFICYSTYMFYVFDRIMDVFTVSMIKNDTNYGLFPYALNYYKCCFMNENGIIDSVDERDYFASFIHCKDNSKRSCSPILKRVVFGVRIVGLCDLLLAIAITGISLLQIIEELDECNQQQDDIPITIVEINDKIK